MTGSLWLALSAILLSAGSSPTPEARPLREGELVKVVLVSRHGVRTPTMSNDVLANYARQPWPGWKEPLGDLTARGRRLATLVGAYHREALAAEKLLAPAGSGCPDAGRVYVYADVTERTELTAQALLDGLAPGCGIRVRSRSPAKVDGVFHPVAAGVCRIDPLEAQSAILARIGGDFPAFVKKHEAEFEALQSILGCCAPPLCSAFGHASACTLSELPTALTSLAGGQGVSMIGALSIASTVSEIFLLEYTDGKPKEQVGWGRADLAGIRKVLPLHDAAFDLLFRTPYIARRQGSSLLARAAGAVTGQPIGGLPAPEPAVRDAAFVAYVGHDDNLAKLGGLLGATWSLPGYPANETPPAGALVFERRRSADGSERVFASFLAQSLEQMREAAPLTLAAPPLRAPIRIPGCSREEPGYPCRVEDFARVVSRTLETECVDRSRLDPAP
jgi:4-phytase/acid phosphatase